ncbi:MAG: hypothetical protein HOO04_05215 [Phycisphaerae bacterium]|nr:hypothetical protein [Phycisphaerae bacterium]MBT5382890.1 hypothetical protein [Phycisphaerae bacterium]MBT5584215.1 hypothetical protein [Phycisphaerae bacterium]MBT5656263.1 hypothetical protein [Phycisphaerae bacterium]
MSDHAETSGDGRCDWTSQWQIANSNPELVPNCPVRSIGRLNFYANAIAHTICDSQKEIKHLKEVPDL